MLKQTSILIVQAINRIANLNRCYLQIPAVNSHMMSCDLIGTRTSQFLPRNVPLQCFAGRPRDSNVNKGRVWRNRSHFSLVRSQIRMYVQLIRKDAEGGDESPGQLYSLRYLITCVSRYFVHSVCTRVYALSLPYWPSAHARGYGSRSVCMLPRKLLLTSSFVIKVPYGVSNLCIVWISLFFSFGFICL